MNILNQTREETKSKAENILWTNQTSNKVTYDNFNHWTQENKKYILNLMSILGYFEYKNSPQYFEKIMKVIYNINKIVSEYNRPINNEFQKLQVYNAACELYFQDIDEDFTKAEQDQIIKRYKTYRGMALLKKYDGDLDHPLLKDRTQQHMMESEFATYLKQPQLKGHREDLQKEYGIEIIQTLNHAS